MINSQFAMQVPVVLAKEQLQSIGHDICSILSDMSARIETLEKQSRANDSFSVTILQ